jgi:hypothetical protein
LIACPLSPGILSFSIKTYLGGKLRTEWVEGNKNPIEELHPEILTTILAAAPLLAEQRREREVAERKRQIAERQRYEEQNSSAENARISVATQNLINMVAVSAVSGTVLLGLLAAKHF